MKQKLGEDSIKALVSYRMQRAQETLKEADTLIKSGFYNAAVNRLYYACYYAVIALLLKNNISTNTHTGVKQMLGMHFIMTGRIDNKYSKFYTQLFNARISGDYDDFLWYDLEMLSELYPQSEEFINAVDIELNK
ncbi:hypothetical protein EZS27_010483 [termite gut metagenome]|uniref:HEPN domain-containing protein n=1 Tax=termite gut metagenome TaxID=433724 RepID=A0A5J4S906_9ZZZZ